MIPQKKILIPAVCLLGAALGLMATFLWRHRDERFIQLEPGRVELSHQKLLEGQKVEVELDFKNGSSETFVIERVHTSCSCTSIRTNDQQQLSAGYKIPPGKKVPLKATIDLTSRSGPQKFYLTIRGKIGDRSFSRESTIHAHVYPGWSVVPSPIVLDDLVPGKTIEKEFLFLDGTPGEDVPLPKVVSSTPELLSAEVIRQMGSNREQLTKKSFAERQVHLLRICFHTPPGLGIRTRALLSFSSEHFPNRHLLLPVTFRTLSEPYSLEPDSIYLAGLSAGQKWSRTVDCEIRNDQASDLVVLQCPEGINVSIVDVSDRKKRLELSGLIPPNLGGEIRVKFGIKGSDIHASLPILYETSSPPSATRR